MALGIKNFGWRCRCNQGSRFACQVPPSPDVMANLFLDYKRSSRSELINFKQYLTSIGFIDPSIGNIGMDNAAQFVATPGGPELLAIPSQPVLGQVQVKVLLVDFVDRPGTRQKTQYEDLLFSRGVHPTGSLRDYYQEVSLGKVDVVGTVSDWLRMPEPYDFYTNNQSGTQWGSYPRNAPRLAEDAVKVAVATGITFEPELDKFNKGIITALLIIHSGRGAETLDRSLQGKHIWSHKWNLKNPVQVSADLWATIYLTVPQDCKLGVCAHELGHLAFQWQDFYDPNYGDDGESWDGTGVWDLMAGGSYNGNEMKPAHPAALHKLQHGWVPSTTVTQSTSLLIKPYTSATGHIYKLVSPKFSSKQYLLLEARKRSGFDVGLPGEGLLVWKVDEPREQTGPDMPGLSLVQADGQNDLNNPNDAGQGDEGDPFPGSTRRTSLSDSGPASTSFVGKRSGISLRNIVIDAAGVVSLDVQIAPSSGASAAKSAKGKAKRKAAPAEAGTKSVKVSSVPRAPASKTVLKRSKASSRKR
jgi:immune inhibitor A